MAGFLLSRKMFLSTLDEEICSRSPAFACFFNVFFSTIRTFSLPKFCCSSTTYLVLEKQMNSSTNLVYVLIILQLWCTLKSVFTDCSVSGRMENPLHVQNRNVGETPWLVEWNRFVGHLFRHFHVRMYVCRLVVHRAILDKDSLHPTRITIDLNAWYDNICEDGILQYFELVTTSNDVINFCKIDYRPIVNNAYKITIHKRIQGFRLHSWIFEHRVDQTGGRTGWLVSLSLHKHDVVQKYIAIKITYQIFSNEEWNAASD